MLLNPCGEPPRSLFCQVTGTVLALCSVDDRWLLTWVDSIFDSHQSAVRGFFFVKTYHLSWRRILAPIWKLNMLFTVQSPRSICHSYNYSRGLQIFRTIRETYGQDIICHSRRLEKFTAREASTYEQLQFLHTCLRTDVMPTSVACRPPVNSDLGRRAVCMYVFTDREGTKCPKKTILARR